MDTYILNLLVIGLLLLGVSLGSRLISRLPCSFALIYLIFGLLLGRYGLKLVQLRPDAEFLERLSEMVVIISVFSCGLKINRPLQLKAWRTTIRLIGALMPITIGAIAVVCHLILGFDWGSAILLGAILAPTDPVLASEVQMLHVKDRDELRFGLTSEGGLNDALAFPFVYFGLYWLKDSHWQNWFYQWLAVDLLWAIASGMIMGVVVAKSIVWLDWHWRRRSGEELRENFLAISIVLLTYALTELVNGYGFLAVFVAGWVAQKHYSVRHSERHLDQLHFTEQLEKILEVGTIVILGSLLLFPPIVKYWGQAFWIAGLLFFLIRPVGVWISTLGSSLPTINRLLFGWFGIRGVGSLYYLTYALGQGLDKTVIEQISWITLITIVLSIILHGVSATPLMDWYRESNREQ